MKPVKRLCILGGVHGNELSGVYLARKWIENKEEVSRSSFETKVCVANPEAVRLNRRYKDFDLNKAFTEEILNSEQATVYEIRRARELISESHEGGRIGPCDVVLDLHNTTANVKLCLIHDESPNHILIPHMMKYIMGKYAEGSCYALARDYRHGFPSYIAGHNSMAVEVGPQPQGALRADIYLSQKKAVKHSLDFIEMFNLGTAFPECELDVYTLKFKVFYPLDDEGNLCAMIHPKLQDKDWKEIGLDHPVFMKHDGSDITLGEAIPSSIADFDTQRYYPVFVNEASYYEKGYAFHMATRKRRILPELQKQL